MAGDGTAPDGLTTSVLTGFLGSGKTTLLRRVLMTPGFADTAVIVNEIGQISIDHHLVDFVEGDVLELPGGCLCCAMREDLAATLRDLLARREAGRVRPFRRIVIETSGLADPGPILFTLGADPGLDERLRLGRVVCVIDAVAGAATLDRFAEAARQTAVADALVISKTDLAPASTTLGDRLAALNPVAEHILGAEVADLASILFAADPTPLPARGARGSGAQRQTGKAEPVHTHGVTALTVVLGRPLTRLDFAKALGGLARDRGHDLLRVKGIVEFADRAGRPALVQGAQHAIFPPQWLDHWPAGGEWADRRGRLVFVVHDMAPDDILERFASAAPSLLGSRRSGALAGVAPALHLHGG